VVSIQAIADPVCIPVQPPLSWSGPPCQWGLAYIAGRPQPIGRVDVMPIPGRSPTTRSPRAMGRTN